MEIQVKKIEHRNETRWAIIMPYHPPKIEDIKKIPGRRYSGSRKCWHLPYTTTSYYALAALPWISSMPPIPAVESNGPRSKSVVLDTDDDIDWKKYTLDCRPKKESTMTIEIIPKVNTYEPKKYISNQKEYEAYEPTKYKPKKCTSRKSKSKKYDRPISSYWLEKVAKYRIYLRHCRYAEATVESYMTSIMVFLAWWGDKSINELTLEQLHLYNDQTYVKKNLSRSAQNQWISAMRMFLKDNAEIDIDGIELERPRMTTYLPNILSEKEVKDLIASYANYKHKMMITMYYACGMRTSELLDLKIADIDTDRNVIRIRDSKGAKDRDIALPKMIQKMLELYYKQYKPVTYVFNGKSGGKYSGSSVNKVLKAGLRKAGITKRITVHGLRHSYATHLAESHVNLRYIQEALGHTSSKTTEIYTKLSSDHIAKMVSPIDKWDNIIST